jgi:hypothetical protein
VCGFSDSAMQGRFPEEARVWCYLFWVIGSRGVMTIPRKMHAGSRDSEQERSARYYENMKAREQIDEDYLGLQFVS